MQHIYNEEKDGLEKSFGDIKKTFDSRTFKYEALIAFWLTVHLEKLETAKMVYDLDPIIEKVVASLRMQGKELIENLKLKEGKDKKKGVLGFFSKKGKPLNDSQS